MDQSSKGDAGHNGMIPFEINVASSVRQVVHTLRSGVHVLDVDGSVPEERIQTGTGACSQLELAAVPAWYGLANGLVIVRGEQPADEWRHSQRARQEHSACLDAYVLERGVVRAIVQRTRNRLVFSDDIERRGRAFCGVHRKAEAESGRVSHAVIECREEGRRTGPPIS